MTEFTAGTVGVGSATRSGDAVAARARGVLIVDDWEPLRHMVGAWLETSGFAVWSASSGDEATTLYMKHQEAIDVVLLDVRMPDRDGPETLASLRALDSRVRCCFMSGDFGKYTEKDLLDQGAVAVFRKPFQMSELTQELERMVGSTPLSTAQVLEGTIVLG